MSKIKFVLLGLVCIGIVGYACKKEPVNSQLFVERYLTGTDFTRWPIQSYVRLELKNTDTLVKDSIDLPVDTAVFNTNLKFIKGVDTIGFSIDETGDHITFSTQPDSTWIIEYLRPSTFKLVHERKETIGTEVTTYKIEQVFKK
ncbi:hypothetical protein [Pedobacter helvus]|uniref:Lipocalin-like domain-containing protein n=1 Tax=Pedobacter helvus TaxID=2563444 RepID=A0ABW9JG16_9SPHI|nr:hypothetical protein [Pedobacter ureilyticus]